MTHAYSLARPRPQLVVDHTMLNRVLTDLGLLRLTLLLDMVTCLVYSLCHTDCVVLVPALTFLGELAESSLGT